jgi:hypothetical protein
MSVSPPANDSSPQATDNAFDAAHPDPDFLIAVIDAVPARLTVIDENDVVTAANGANLVSRLY